MSYDEYIKKEEAAISNDNCIDKDPEKLTKEEINYIRTHIDGIWYIK